MQTSGSLQREIVAIDPRYYFDNVDDLIGADYDVLLV